MRPFELIPAYFDILKDYESRSHPLTQELGYLRYIGCVSIVLDIRTVVWELSKSTDHSRKDGREIRLDLDARNESKSVEEWYLSVGILLI